MAGVTELTDSTSPGRGPLPEASANNNDHVDMIDKKYIHKSFFEQWIEDAVNSQNKIKLRPFRVGRDKKSWFAKPKIKNLLNCKQIIDIMSEPYIHLMPVEERSQAILPLFISIASFLLKTNHELISWLDGDFFEAIKVTISNPVATFDLLQKPELELIRRFLSIMVELSLNNDETEIYSDFLRECLSVIVATIRASRH